MSKDRLELESQVLEIQQWLGTLSSELQNESYEINEFTVEYLYQLCQLSKKRDEHLEQMIKDNSDKAEEYSTENDRIGKELEKLGLSESCLDDKCKETLTELADVGNDLALSNPTLENYLVNLSDHTIEEVELKDKLKIQEALLQDITEKLESLDLTTAKLTEELKNAENTKNDNIDFPVEIETAKAQAQHYVESTKEFKKLLSASGIKKEYTHEYLQKMSEKVGALSSEIEATNKRIAEFKELPPSIPLAKEKIKQIKIEIETVEQEFPELQCIS